MKTASFKMAFISGLMGLAYSSREVTERESNIAEDEHSNSIEEVPATMDNASDQSETDIL